MPEATDWDITKTEVLDEETQIRSAETEADIDSEELDDEIRVYYRGAQLAPRFFLVFEGSTTIPVEDRVRVGRNFLNEAVVFGDRFVSRRHAEIGVRNGEFYLVDLGSSNGTYLNGRAIPRRKSVRLEIGDRILFGAEVEAVVEAPLTD